MNIMNIYSILGFVGGLILLIILDLIHNRKKQKFEDYQKLKESDKQSEKI